MILTIFTDGASRGNPGKASSGFVVFNEYQEKIFEEGKYLGIATNNFAEYTAVLRALEYVKENFPNARVNFLMDSKLVCEQLSGRYRVKSPNLIPLVSKIKGLIKDPNKITYKHIPRAMNFLADAMCNKALDSL